MTEKEVGKEGARRKGRREGEESRGKKEGGRRKEREEEGTYLLLLPHIIQSQGAKDGLNFNLKPEDKWGPAVPAYPPLSPPSVFLLGQGLTQAGFQLSLYPRRTSNSQFSCLCLSSAGSQHLHSAVGGPRASCMQSSHH